MGTQEVIQIHQNIIIDWGLSLQSCFVMPSTCATFNCIIQTGWSTLGFEENSACIMELIALL